MEVRKPEKQEIGKFFDLLKERGLLGDGSRRCYLGYDFGILSHVSYDFSLALIPDFDKYPKEILIGSDVLVEMGGIYVKMNKVSFFVPKEFIVKVYEFWNKFGLYYLYLMVYFSAEASIIMGKKLKDTIKDTIIYKSLGVDLKELALSDVEYQLFKVFGGLLVKFLNYLDKKGEIDWIMRFLYKQFGNGLSFENFKYIFLDDKDYYKIADRREVIKVVYPLLKVNGYW
ncbi:MAG: hypothetical protein ABIK77_03395 [candidate division WOR-3 bacterium]|uniref:Uncharacterized protein n=1 Tax=candidate division WOR-3 bacterium TaxID=2052148 RepID=A0A7V4FEU0_UNCW3